MKTPRKGEAADSPPRRTNATLITLLGGLILLLAIVAFFATSRSADQDKLTNSEVVTSSTPSRDKLCASNATYELIKRELFRRAAQVRGSDQAAYDKLASFAVVRMENPVEENENSKAGTINCSGSLSLDLPPGVAVAGGRRSLMSDVDYSVAAAAGGGATLAELRNVESIVTPLATLMRVREVEPDSPYDATGNDVAPQGNSTGPEEPSAAPAAGANPVASGSRPSFDCRTARSRGEEAICSDPGLAALDRQMADQYARAFSGASPAQRVILRDTAHRFYGYRDRCPSNACIGDAYAGRMREIRDIVEGRWQAPKVVDKF